MTTTASHEGLACTLMPLLRAVGREITERTRSIADLGQRLDASTEPQNLQAARAIHLRELRRCQKELERLGCTIDQNDPLRIVCPTETGLDYELQLDDTPSWPSPSAV